MRFEIYLDGIKDYDEKLAEEIRNKMGKRVESVPIKAEDFSFWEEGLEAEINTLEELIAFVKMHPDKEVIIYAPDDGMPSINYEDVRDPYEERFYGMDEEEIMECEEIFKALKDSKIFYINDEGDDFYCETDSGVSFIPTALQWAY